MSSQAMVGALMLGALGCSVERGPATEAAGILGFSATGRGAEDAAADGRGEVDAGVGPDAAADASSSIEDAAQSPADASADAGSPACDGGGSCEAVCGNGQLDESERCDDSSDLLCPTACDDADPCTTDRLMGSAQNCDAVCVYSPIAVAAEGDGCCPPGLGADSDGDCIAACGNGVVEGTELCEKASAAGCPVACSDGDPCTHDVRQGAAITCDVQCAYPPVTMPLDSDECCPQGAYADNDSDCVWDCGNGIVEAVGGETCEPGTAIVCPASCDDGNACTRDVLRGSSETCDARCEYLPVTEAIDGDSCCPVGATSLDDSDCSASCGNGLLEGAETCEAGSPFPCPDNCDDGNPCTSDAVVGTPQQCNVVCSNRPITQPIGGDACCPQGADANNDSDCLPVCGNGVVEPGESCEAGSGSECPTSCHDGDPCTRDERLGSVDGCDARCRYAPITELADGDLCCPPGANSTTDDDCLPRCGNGLRERDESCDDGDDNGTVGRCRTDCSGEVPTLAAIHAQVIEMRCGPCHLEQSRGGLDLSTVARTRAGLVGVTSSSCNDQVLVVPGDPAASLLLRKLDPGASLPAGCSSSHPGRHQLPPEELAMLREWIAALR